MIADGDLPILIWGRTTSRIRLANEAAAQLCELPLQRLIGYDIRELFDRDEGLETVRAAIRSDAVGAMQLERPLVRPSGERVHVSWWTRSIAMDRGRGCATIGIPTSELSRLVTDPSEPWRNLGLIVIGLADRRWQIEFLSHDGGDILGGSSAHLIGRPLPQLIHPDDAHRLTDLVATAAVIPIAIPTLRLRGARDWVEGCLLAAPRGDGGPGFIFAVAGAGAHPATVDRALELEQRLRRIAEELRAAGVLDVVADQASPQEFPELRELTSRQLDILHRLVDGDRVPTIAGALRISRSTVRNHLAAIFSKFGVHSQAELVALLRRGTQRSA